MKGSSLSSLTRLFRNHNESAKFFSFHGKRVVYSVQRETCVVVLKINKILMITKPTDVVFCSGHTKKDYSGSTKEVDAPLLKLQYLLTFHGLGDCICVNNTSSRPF